MTGSFRAAQHALARRKICSRGTPSTQPTRGGHWGASVSPRTNTSPQIRMPHRSTVTARSIQPFLAVAARIHRASSSHRSTSGKSNTATMKGPPLATSRQMRCFCSGQGANLECQQHQRRRCFGRIQRFQDYKASANSPFFFYCVSCMKGLVPAMTKKKTAERS